MNQVLHVTTGAARIPSQRRNVVQLQYKLNFNYDALNIDTHRLMNIN